MSSVAVSKRIAALTADFEALLAESVDGSAAERAATAYEWERFERRLPAMRHQVVASLAGVPAEELGEPSLASALSTLLRISKAEANRRIHEAEDLGPRTAMTGEPLAPMLTNTAAAQRRGQIGAEHVQIIRRFFDQLPDFVDHHTREAAEADLAQFACGLRPEELRAAADRLAILLDQDGELSDGDRARRRYLIIGKQQSDGMSEIRGRIDPECRAALDAVFAKWAAPGMCNPDDESPCSGRRSAGRQRQRRPALHRTTQPRRAQSDEPRAAGVGAAGQPQRTARHAGHLHDAHRAGIRARSCRHRRRHPAADVRGDPTSGRAHHYLVVFDDHTERPLYLGRAKRLASAGQRIVLYARDRGCTFPGCTVPGY